MRASNSSPARAAPPRYQPRQSRLNRPRRGAAALPKPEPRWNPPPSSLCTLHSALGLGWRLVLPPPHPQARFEVTTDLAALHEGSEHLVRISPGALLAQRALVVQVEEDHRVRFLREHPEQHVARRQAVSPCPPEPGQVAPQ